MSKNDKLFLDYKIDESISKQNKEIEKIIKEINDFLEWKKYGEILINSLSLLWKQTFWIKYSIHARNQNKDISNFPWIMMKSPFWKDIYNFKEWFNYIKKIEYIEKNNIIFLNNILTDFINTDYKLSSKKLIRREKLIFETISWKYINQEMKNFLDLLNNWIDWKFEASIIWYLFYLFTHIHPFHDWNWRTMRVLIEYIITKKLWCKIPCIFLNFYFNYTKQEHYEILKELNVKKEWSLEKFIYSINEWIIKQASISLKILKNLDNYINFIIKELDELWYKNTDLISDIYSNLYYQNKKPHYSDELENLLLYFVENKWFKYYMYKWNIYYYDQSFIDILKEKY